jgi:hypothetical protein
MYQLQVHLYHDYRTPLMLIEPVGVVKWYVKYMLITLPSYDIDSRNATEANLFVALASAPIEVKTANIQMLRAVRVHRR